MSDTAGPTVALESWGGPWPEDDPDANFKREVALYSKLDPLSTIQTLSANLDIPVGVLCRYVLAKWTAAGAEALLAMGPSALSRLWESVERADADGSDRAKLTAYDELRAQIGWLKAGFEDPGAYPR